MPGQDETYDFVIVGSGGGSMCAALLMRSMGKTAIILEKMEVVGGSTAMSGGVLWLPNNGLNRAAGVPDSPELSLKYLESLTTPDPGRGGTPQRRKAFVDNAPVMLDFLQRQGIQLERAGGYSDYYDDQPGGLAEGRAVVARIFDVNRLGREWAGKLRLTGLTLPLTIKEVCRIVLVRRTWEARAVAARLMWRLLKGKLTGQRLVGTGAALQGRMLEASVKAGVEIRVNSPVRKLIVEDGRVCGVVVSRDGKDQRVLGKLGVLINAGGFARNEQMRSKYQPGSSSAWTNANPGDTGEMIEEVLRVGGSVDLMDESWWISVSVPPNAGSMLPMHLMDIAKPHAFLVDAGAQRFCDEAASYMEVGQRQLARTRQGVNATPAWMIFDSQHRSKYMVSGAQPGRTPREWVEAGYLKVSDTLADLARQCGLDPDALAATTERFNRFADRGVDEDFHRGRRRYDSWFGDPTHRPSATLGAVRKGPFYALQVYPGDVGTAGGVVTDEHGRALTADGKVIPGLYVTGNSAAPVTGHYYVGPGTSIGASFTFGFLAAKHATAGSRTAVAHDEDQRPYRAGMSTH
ncbi:MAG TPA: FAD-binding protein [Phenylobacterium sp.]|uniref:FAD-binding protein n=1 Tax=Phenylobacterium sp. TaxID=1871053 RepID=UPI002B49D579|nr:FAD-binding protein [Phenylobacterium sp.]HKR87463.1 FAD-binding protein [Phenylobacterium sp.]HKT54146.1 FAD-binding protein [Caulobacteraceae bacterium]